jgi:uncharacterized membrane protein
VGVTAALFPPLGIGIATASGAGAVIGGVAGHVSKGMSRGDLKDLGEALDEGQAGLVVVYAFNLAEQVGATIKAANRVVSRETDMAADELVADLKRAEEPAAIPEQRQPEPAPEKAETTPG